MKRKKLSLGMVLLCWAAGLWSGPVRAQAAPSAAVKAAYVYRFLEYVTWPTNAFPTAEERLLIGTVEYDEVSAELGLLARDRLVNGRKIEVVLVKDAASVHVLYAARLESPRVQKIVDAVRHRPVLVITEDSAGLDRGGVINFVFTGNRIQFEVSLEAAGRAGLNLSARLLTVAARVRKSELLPPGYAQVVCGTRYGLREVQFGELALRTCRTAVL